MTRQAKHERLQREAGWTKIGVWLSPDDQKRLDALVERYGSKTQAVRVMLVTQCGIIEDSMTGIPL